jgi:hypothetical protein
LPEPKDHSSKVEFKLDQVLSRNDTLSVVQALRAPDDPHELNYKVSKKGGRFNKWIADWQL